MSEYDLRCKAAEMAISIFKADKCAIIPTFILIDLCEDYLNENMTALEIAEIVKQMVAERNIDLKKGFAGYHPDQEETQQSVSSITGF